MLVFYKAMNRFLSLWLTPHCSSCYSKLSFKEEIFCTECFNHIKPLVVLREIERLDLFMVQTWEKYFSVIDHYQMRSVYDILGAIKFRFKRYQLYYLLEILKPSLDLLKKEELTHITYMPLSIRKTIFRGFNPSLIIAQFLAQELGVPCIKGLKKIETVSQSKKNRADRVNMFRKPPFKTVKNSFLNQESRILLVDDIITTGVTISSAGLMIKSLYQCTMFGFTLFDATPQKRYKDLLEKAATAKLLSE